jgi:hypothetical protein
MKLMSYFLLLITYVASITISGLLIPKGFSSVFKLLLLLLFFFFLHFLAFCLQKCLCVLLNVEGGNTMKQLLSNSVILGFVIIKPKMMNIFITISTPSKMLQLFKKQQT